MGAAVTLRSERTGPSEERVKFCGVIEPEMPKGKAAVRLTFPLKPLMLLAVMVMLPEPP